MLIRIELTRGEFASSKASGASLEQVSATIHSHDFETYSAFVLSYPFA